MKVRGEVDVSKGAERPGYQAPDSDSGKESQEKRRKEGWPGTLWEIDAGQGEAGDGPKAKGDEAAGEEEDDAERIGCRVGEWMSGKPTWEPAADEASEGTHSDAERENERKGEGTLILAGHLGDCGGDADGPDRKSDPCDEGERELDGQREHQRARGEDGNSEKKREEQRRPQAEPASERAGWNCAGEASGGHRAGD